MINNVYFGENYLSLRQIYNIEDYLIETLNLKGLTEKDRNRVGELYGEVLNNVRKTYVIEGKTQRDRMIVFLNLSNFPYSDFAIELAIAYDSSSRPEKLKRLKVLLEEIGATNIHKLSQADGYCFDFDKKVENRKSWQVIKKRQEEYDKQWEIKMKKLEELDKYKPDEKTLTKLKEYKEKQVRVNIASIKSDDKLLTYYYGALLIGFVNLEKNINWLIYDRSKKGNCNISNSLLKSISERVYYLKVKENIDNIANIDVGKFRPNNDIIKDLEQRKAMKKLFNVNSYLNFLKIEELFKYYYASILIDYPVLEWQIFDTIYFNFDYMIIKLMKRIRRKANSDKGK